MSGNYPAGVNGTEREFYPDTTRECKACHCYYDDDGANFAGLCNQCGEELEEKVEALGVQFGVSVFWE